MSDKKILIVDDDKIINELVKERLEAYGYSTVSAFDGSEAIKTATDENPDLILLDMTMPGGRGEVIYARLKQLYVTENTPVLIMTAGNTETFKRFLESKEIPEEDVFIKPIDFTLLHQRIDELLI